MKIKSWKALNTKRWKHKRKWKLRAVISARKILKLLEKRNHEFLAMITAQQLELASKFIDTAFIFTRISRREVIIALPIIFNDELNTLIVNLTDRREFAEKDHDEINFLVNTRYHCEIWNWI